MQIADLNTYELIESQELSDIQSTGYILRHKKSGARVTVISNSDENKVFYIGFRTPPEDETGVPHIIEHTVLCGSEKFPVKDPFVELVKGSLNTFLNAMTYPDKTIYPIASCNEKDFQNLMDVYLDAVFHPNIYKHQEIFKQEGWHYELESEDAPLTINGVVYNEMKGAYSSAEETLQQKIDAALFPDNTYGKDSGGNPKHIPELTYEEYLDFHRRYYHPVNSYIYLYGDMDVAEKLDWMDREYLSAYDEIELDSTIPYQKPAAEVQKVFCQYPIASEDSKEDNTYLSYNLVVGGALDKTLYQAFDILDYALVSAPGAPLKKALIDAGIGKDISGGYSSGTLQPTFSITAKKANSTDQERFVTIIRETLEKLVKNGLNKKALLAGINSAEFRFREADFGQFPKGLLYGIQCLDSWLFDDGTPFLHLECLDTFQFLKDQIKNGYFEQLIHRYLLSNTHGAFVIMEPQKGLNAREEEALEAQLQAYKEGMTPEEIQKLIQETRHLKQYQEEPSPKEDLERIPMLSREDMKKEAMPLDNILEKLGNIPVVRHDVAANGIDYVTLMFDAADVAAEDIPYLGILKTVLGYVDTESYGYSDLANEINIYTGGISSGIAIYPNVKNKGELQVKYEVRVKVLESNLEQAMNIVNEILLTSKLEDTKRLHEIVSQTKSRLQQALSGAGHSVSSMRAMSYYSKYAFYQDSLNGIAFYRKLEALERNFDQEVTGIQKKLRALIAQLFAADRLLISFTAETKAYEKAVPVLMAGLSRLPAASEKQKNAVICCQKKNEGFTDASQVQYVSRAGDFAAHGFQYNGALKILKLILSYDYLWINVRVKGGAYGCMSGFLRTGEAYFTSYRDPNLGKTNEIYNQIPDYLRNFDANERDMTKYIIGTFSSLDTPLYPEARGSRSMSAYLCGLTETDIQKERDQIRTATKEDIRGLADMIQAVLDDQNICVIGNEDVIRKEAELFEKVESLY